jgi:hypothetical protein
MSLSLRLDYYAFTTIVGPTGFGVLARVTVRTSPSDGNICASGTYVKVLSHGGKISIIRSNIPQ